MKNFILTSGDRDGVGLEVSVKALGSLGPQKGVRLLLATHESAKKSVHRRHWATLAKRWNIVEIHGSSLRDALPTLSLIESDELLVFFDSSKKKSAEAEWVEVAARAAFHKKPDQGVDGLITGPVSKERFLANHRRDMGHTGLLSRITGTTVYQGYIGDKLAISLATDHVELRNVEKALTAKRLSGAYRAALQLRGYLPKTKARLPIGVLGLNPHAGEKGTIGQFEKSRIVLPAGFVGPLSADAAFHPASLKKFSSVLALYHDQGLIPFKMLHGQDSGFQISLGLPFTRTSVDHGTAKDLFAKDRANPGSMRDAIEAAFKRTT